MDAIGELIGATVGLIFDLLISLLTLAIRGFLHSIEFMYLAVTKGITAACQNTKKSWADEREVRRTKPLEKQQQAATNSAMSDQTMIIIGLVVIASLVTGLTFWGLESIQQRRIESTRTQVRRIVNRIAKDAEMGIPLPVQGDLAERDAWKQPIRLFVDEALLGELYVVRSSGPDRKSGTIDDILSPEIRIASLKEVSGELIDRGHKKVKEKFTETLNRFKDRNKANKPESN